MDSELAARTTSPMPEINGTVTQAGSGVIVIGL